MFDFASRISAMLELTLCKLALNFHCRPVGASKPMERPREAAPNEGERRQPVGGDRWRASRLSGKRRARLIAGAGPKAARILPLSLSLFLTLCCAGNTITPSRWPLLTRYAIKMACIKNIINPRLASNRTRLWPQYPRARS